jgi:hypothetical protein
VDLPHAVDLITMRHARADALDELEPMLVALRALPGLTERGRGVFYRGSRAFLHFHEDISGHHVDVRLAVEFERFRVQTKAEQRAVLAKVRRLLTG